MDRDFPAAILVLMVIIFLVILALFVVSDIKEDMQAMSDRITEVEICCSGEDAKQ